MQNLVISPPALRRHPISVEMYHIMAEQGAFGPEDRVELIGGEIIDMSPIGTLHARCVDFLNRFLADLAGGEYIVRVQNPIVLNDDTEPQPDVTILRFREDFYKFEAPGPDDVLLVIEVSDTSYDFDRKAKLPRYAAAEIAETWLIDIISELVEVHFEPKESTYGTAKIYQRGGTILSTVLPSLSLSVNELFG